MHYFLFLNANSIRSLFTLAHRCTFTSNPLVDMSFLANKELPWDNYTLIEERKKLNSSILVIHVDVRDRVNSDSAIVKMARGYAETSAQSRSLSFWYLNHLDNTG